VTINRIEFLQAIGLSVVAKWLDKWPIVPGDEVEPQIVVPAQKVKPEIADDDAVRIFVRPGECATIRSEVVADPWLPDPICVYGYPRHSLTARIAADERLFILQDALLERLPLQFHLAAANGVHYEFRGYVHSIDIWNNKVSFAAEGREDGLTLVYDAS